MVRQARLHTRPCPACGVARVPGYTVCPFCNRPYRVPPARPAAPTLLLVSRQGVREFTIPVDGLRIGYGSWNDVVLSDPTVSRQHALVWAERGTGYVRDLGSTNGTWLNGRPVWRPTPIREGDRLQIGAAAFAVRLTRTGPAPVGPQRTRATAQAPSRPWERSHPQVPPPQVPPARRPPPRTSPPQERGGLDLETSPRLPPAEVTTQPAPSRGVRELPFPDVRRLSADVGVTLAVLGFFMPWLQSPGVGSESGVALMGNPGLLPGYVLSLILGIPAVLVLILLLFVRPTDEAISVAWAKSNLVLAAAASLPALSLILSKLLIPNAFQAAGLQWGVWTTAVGLGLTVLGSAARLAGLRRSGNRESDAASVLRWGHRATSSLLGGLAVLLPLAAIVAWRWPAVADEQLATVSRSNPSLWVVFSVAVAATLLALVSVSLLLPRGRRQYAGAPDYLVIVLSPGSVASPQVQQELSVALMASLSDRNIVVLPVLYRDCEILLLWRDRHHVDFRTDYQADLRGLLEVFGRESVIRLKRGADVLFDLSRVNGTFANRKRIMRAALQDGDRIKVGNIDTVLGARL